MMTATSRPAPRALLVLLLVAAMALGAPRPAQAAPITAEAIETADYSGGPLPSGQSALTAKVQIMLDRSGISPGVIDGIAGGMSRSAIAAFERRSGLPADGEMDMQVWQALQAHAGRAMTVEYTVTAEDAANLTTHIPSDYVEKANMTTLGYTSIAEKLGERFHMDERFLAALNPGVELAEGVTITVIAPAKPLTGRVTRILVEKATNRVAGFDASGHMVVNYPATIGSAQTPSPSGTHKVRTVAMNPEYTYNPSINFTQGENKSVLTLPPGPNGPVGTVWIALSKPTYGLHGTPTPSRLFVSESHGCVRLTNWDAEELAHMVQPGETSVEFLEKDQSIASVMGETSPAPIAGQAAGTADRGSLTLTATRAPLPRPVGLTGGPTDPLAAAVEQATDLPVVAVEPEPAATQPTPAANATSRPQINHGR
ncbi:L,D-transpeptidase family protein [Paracoccus jeotgali]|uniref:L,D-transpeptidase family protein n=1 Tax=Paracoccus jeotgali TaxID=2065379 RepID=UPI001CEF8702|nr:L,D-transpeptidase [Paracoccus jeotgali]